MRDLHFSLRWMFGFVTFLAVGCGLLVYATPFLSRLTLTAVLVVLLTSVAAAACQTGERRAFWAGFAFFGLAYGWVVCGSWQSPAGDGLLQNRLVTGAILEWCHQRAPRTQTSIMMTQSPAPAMVMGGAGGMPGAMPASMGAGMGMPGGPAGAGMGTASLTTMTVAQAPDWVDFVATGHSLFALAFALLGGVIARRCYEKAKPKTGG